MAQFTLTEGQIANFVWGSVAPETADPCTPISNLETGNLFKSTVEYWRKWLSKSNYMGRWREMVERSALALKLLTFEDTGAIVAAPTCSLPEDLGGVRN